MLSGNAYLCVSANEFTMNKAIRIFLTISILCSTYFLSPAEDLKSNVFSRYNALGMNVRPSYVMPTHGYYNGWNPAEKKIRAGGSFDMQFLFSKEQRGVYQGVGAAIHTFFADDLIGTPATIYIFQGAPLARLSDRMAVGYEWNLGVSSGWKINGDVLATPMNVYINVAALFSYRLNDSFDLIFGPEYTHFSNGDTKFPNGGANTVNFRVGVRGNVRSSEDIMTERIFSSEQEPEPFADRWSYDILALGGFRADRTLSDGKLYIFNQAFPVASVNVNPLYGFNDYLYAGPSLDLLYDRSANLSVTEDETGKASFIYPTFLNQMSAGLSLRAELKMPVYAVNIGIGYSLQLGNHTRTKSRDLQSLYGIFGLKAFVSDRLFLNVTYRLSSVLYTHNLLFGLGWRFGSI